MCQVNYKLPKGQGMYLRVYRFLLGTALWPKIKLKSRIKCQHGIGQLAMFRAWYIKWKLVKISVVFM